MMKLYDYFRSTACYRVRIALNLKKIDFEAVPVHLVNQGGAQNSPAYVQINPQRLVPSLAVDDQILTQSLAIIEYLDESYPEIPLLPQDPLMRAKVRALALLVCCDIHPLNNLRVLAYLKTEFSADEKAVANWYHHWLRAGFDAFEAHLKTYARSHALCYGDKVTLADICLIPQVYNAERFNFPLDDYPLIKEINAYCRGLSAFAKAAPGS